MVKASWEKFSTLLEGTKTLDRAPQIDMLKRHQPWSAYARYQQNPWCAVTSIYNEFVVKQALVQAQLNDTLQTTTMEQ
jgi:hypothetical protein